MAAIFLSEKIYCKDRCLYELKLAMDKRVQKFVKKES